MTEARIAAQAMRATASVTARSRLNLALHHLFAACRFSARVAKLESENSGQALGAFWEEILHNCLGVAMLSVSALESYANEIYFEGAVLKRSLNSAASEEIAVLIDKEPILRKFALALSLTAGKRLDMGSAAAQNVDALIRLRNAVVHFRPEWSDDQGAHAKLSKLLEHRFALSTFFPGEPPFPHAWTSHSFTVWAVTTTVNFVDQFYCELGSTSPIEQFRGQLHILSAA